MAHSDVEIMSWAYSEYDKHYGVRRKKTYAKTSANITRRELKFINFILIPQANLG